MSKMKKGFIYLISSAMLAACHMELPPNPVADFSFPAEKCEAPCVMTFTSTSQNADSYEWDFDDKNVTATGAQVTYQFESGRTYYVKLLAKSKSGGSHGITKTVVIDEKPESKPVAKFRYEPTGDIFVGGQVSFFNQSENSTRLVWNFGEDNNTQNSSTEDRPVHSYSRPGSYSVKLTAFNSKNDSDFTLQTIVVKPRAVVAAFDAGGTEHCIAPCTITLTNKSQNADTYQWTFGDGSTYTGQNPGIAYFERAGNYRITLIASGPGGSDTTYLDVHVKSSDFTAIAITGAGDFWGNDIIVDASGNVYVCGLLSGEADFGNGVIRSGTGSSKDFFVAKYDKGGQCVWAKVIGGPGWDEAHKIILDNAGSVYVSGEVDGRINASFATEPFGGRDGFIAKLDPKDGIFQWFKTIGGPADDAVYGLAYSGFNDRIYIAGKVSGNGVNFNGTIQNAVGQDIFFVFVNPSTGEVRQPTIIGGPGDQAASSLVADDAGNAYVTGTFKVGLTFPDNHGVPALSSMGDIDGFVAKWVINPGKWQWAGQAASSGRDDSDEIVIDNARNVYITGTHTGTMPRLGIGSAGDNNVFVARWNEDGSLNWARNGVSDGSIDYAGGMAMSSSGNILVHGTFSRTGQFPFNENNLLSTAGGMDVFVSEIGTNAGHSTGSPSKSGGGSGTDRAKGIFATPDGHIYSIGSFSGTATFNGETLTSKSQVNEGLNIFIVKWK
jgi:PKD repeat protein